VKYIKVTRQSLQQLFYLVYLYLVYFATDGLLEWYFIPQHVTNHYIRSAMLVNSRCAVNVFTHFFFSFTVVLCILILSSLLFIQLMHN